MGATGSRLRGRAIWCSISFALFGYALVELSELSGCNPSPHRSSSCTRKILNSVLCGSFGLFLAKLSGLRDCANIPKEDAAYYCSICMESKPLSDSFSTKHCPHSFCKSCIGLYVAAKLLDNSFSISCPEPGCKDGKLEPEACCRIVAPEVLDRWELALCEKMIKAKFYCPFKDCSAVLDDDRADRSAIREAECPYCRRLFCAQCEVPWHAGVSCKEYMKLGKDERAPGDLLVVEMAKTQKWQRCPKCKFYVERTEGCMFMKCRCGFKFCYRCGTETVNDHYCAKCKR